MSEKRNLIIGLVGVGVVCIFGIIFILIVNDTFDDDEFQKVEFVDEKMAEVISESAQRDGLVNNPEDLLENDLQDIKRLNIGYIEYYSTLSDITKCPNLEELYIGVPKLFEYSYYVYDVGSPTYRNKMDISQLENEMSDILEECNKVRRLYICDKYGICELTSIEFLENGKGIQELWIEDQKAIDYSPVLNCKELTILSLDGCDVVDLGKISTLSKLSYLSLTDTDIASAGDIVNLPNLKVLCVINTPLAENEEELARIYEALPDIKVYK